MHNQPKLYRKRFIPQETIHLKDDVILFNSDTLIITKWNTLKPRSDISHGISAYFIEKNFKISKIFNPKNKFVHWYCDIIHVSKNLADNSIIFEDLLIDVIIYDDNFVKVVDVEEVADAHEAGLISLELMYKSLRSANELLNIIYKGDFGMYIDILNSYDTTLEETANM